MLRVEGEVEGRIGWEVLLSLESVAFFLVLLGLLWVLWDDGSLERR